MQKTRTRRKALMVSMAAVTLVATSHTALAQSDFFKRGGELLRQIPGAGSSQSSPARGLSDADIGAELREALKVGAKRAGRKPDQRPNRRLIPVRSRGGIRSSTSASPSSMVSSTR